MDATAVQKKMKKRFIVPLLSRYEVKKVSPFTQLPCAKSARVGDDRPKGLVLNINGPVMNILTFLLFDVGCDDLIRDIA